MLSLRSARAVCSIDLDALAHNVSEVRRVVGASVRVCAVVKANAYGHGAVAIARALVAAGVDRLAVAVLDEAAELRAAGIDAPLLVLAGVAAGDCARALELDVAAVVSTAAMARDLGGVMPASRRLRVHLKVDTGMHRLGAVAAEIEALALALRDGPFEVEGAMSHLACADEPGTATVAAQLTRFEAALALIGQLGLDPPLRHLANSAGLLADARTHFDMVRPGLSLYGCLPHPDFAARIDLHPVMTFRTQILLIKSVDVGSGVGYGHRFRAARPSRIAVVPVGYAQGYPRALGDRASALVRGVPVPVAGTVSMDYLSLDVTDVAAARVGDDVILWGGSGAARIDVMDLGAKAGTIGYELLARVSPTIRREIVGSQHPHPSEEDPSA